MRVLVTGFGPFPGVPENPTAAAVAELARLAPVELPEIDLVTAILPVDFNALRMELPEILARAAADLVLLTGVNQRATTLEIERVAVNLVDARIPDNSGSAPIDEQVVPGAPDGLLARVPVKAMRAAIEAEGVSANLSLSAGTYACNAAMYLALEAAPMYRAGFIHVPPAQVLAPEQVARALLAALRAAIAGNEISEAGGELA